MRAPSVGAPAIAGIIGSLSSWPVDDEAAAGLVDDEARFSGRQQVAGIADCHAEAGFRGAVAPATVPVADLGDEPVGDFGGYRLAGRLLAPCSPLPPEVSTRKR
jgi:hypothetical protein